MMSSTGDSSFRARARLMREALVEAKMSLAQSRKARDATAAQLERERTELTTVQRRGQLAAGINDTETVRLAGEFERKHAERIAVLERKLGALEQEVALAERETADMTAQLKKLTGGVDTSAPASAPADDPLAPDLSELDTLRHTADRATREADAESRLAELKRRMGK